MIKRDRTNCGTDLRDIPGKRKPKLNEDLKEYIERSIAEWIYY